MVKGFWRRNQSTEEGNTQVPTVSERIDSLNQQVAAIRNDVAELARSRNHEASAANDGPATHLPKELNDYAKHVKLLRIAADIATATLNCHRDTWAYLTEKAAPQPQHFRTPGDITDTGGRIETTISGRSLAAILTALWTIAHSPHASNAELVDWALAVTLYEQTASTVERLRHGPQGHDAPVVITIDRYPATTPTGRDHV